MICTYTEIDETSDNFRIDLLCKVNIFEPRLHGEGNMLKPVKKFVLLTTIDNSSAYNYLGLG